MRLTFPYPGYEQIAPVDVPDARLLGVYRPRSHPEVDEEAVLAEAFRSPIKAQPLREALRGRRRVLILIDDGTRGTPVHRILPYVLAECAAAGIPDQAIAFLTAQGTHRRMGDEELARKLGPFHGRFTVHQHDWKDATALRRYGTTRDGTPVTANRLLGEHDFLLGIGSIVPHRVKGVSGGAKIAFPGVAGPELMDRNQWEASMHMSTTVMGECENPMRLRMEEAAEIVGLRYIVNVVTDADHRIVACVTGDVVAAHRTGAQACREVFTARLPRQADIVIADSYPADRDFWQSAKGIYAGTIATRVGGSLILVAPNPEGVASNHPNVMAIGYRPHAEIVRMAQEGKIDDLVGAAILADVSQIVDQADCIMVSPGVRPEDAQRLGFRSARTVQEALHRALERQGQGAKVAVLQHGGHILPVIEHRRSATG